MVVHIRRLSLFGLLLAATAAVPPSTVHGVAADDDAGPLLATVRTAVADGRLQQSREVGFTLGKKQFRDTPDDAGFLTGLDIGLGKFMDIENIYAVRANFWTDQGDVRLQEHGHFRDKRLPSGKVVKTKVLHTVHIQARPGYAVGGLTIRSGLNINGLSVTFMKIDGAVLDPTRSYVSDWIGDDTGGGETVIDGKGAPVAALFGSQDDEKATALGLVFAPSPAAAVAPPAAVQSIAPFKPLPRAAQPPRRKAEASRHEVEPLPQTIPEEAPQAVSPPAKSETVPAEPTTNSNTAVAEAESWPLWASAGIPAVAFLAVAGLCLLGLLIPFGRSAPQAPSAADRPRARRPKKAAADLSSAVSEAPRRAPRQRPLVNEEVIELSEKDYLPAADQPILDALPAD